MSKRKLDDFEESSNDSDGNGKSQKINNAVDSDDEEVEDDSLKYALKDEDIEGQEDGVAESEGDIQYTGFNMKEELEEGHFDKDGMYHWKKEKEIKDNWLDNIDWIKVRQTEGGSGLGSKMESADSDDESNQIDIKECYKKILTYLQPKESISKALKRLGGNRSLSASERLKLKKAGQLEKVMNEQSTNSAQLTDLTELANKILTDTGNMDVYQETYEMIQGKITESSKCHAKEAVLDMYADDFEDKEKERLQDSSVKQDSESETAHQDDVGGEIMWEVKRTENSESIEGPFTSAQMNDWSHKGHFGNKALVRKCGSTEFYNCKRMDFELYL